MENTPRGTIVKLLPSCESLALYLSAQVWKAELPTAAVHQSISKTHLPRKGIWIEFIIIIIIKK